jgi:hypothetical protein
MVATRSAARQEDSLHTISERLSALPPTDFLPVRPPGARRQVAGPPGWHLLLPPPPPSPAQASNKFAAVLVPLFEVGCRAARRARRAPAAQVRRRCCTRLALPQEEDGTVKVWLTQRAAHLSTHQGEVCLPGGRSC